MSAFVTMAEAERLYAQGWRAERSLLDGPRIVWDQHDHFYATIVPGESDSADFYWAVWTKRDGNLTAQGQHPDPVVASLHARGYIEESR